MGNEISTKAATLLIGCFLIGCETAPKPKAPPTYQEAVRNNRTIPQKAVVENVRTVPKAVVEESNYSSVGSRSFSSKRSSATQWFQGGDLHRATIAEWRKASYQNKLATASDWLAGTIWKGHLKTPEDFVRLKLKSQMLVNAVDRTIAGLEIDYMKVAEIATSLIALSNDFSP